MSELNHGWSGLRIDPLDTLFFRDGRPFDAANRVAGGLPNPQTLAGAIRTALLARTGFDFARFARQRKTGDVEAALAECQADPGVVDAHLRGPFLALADDRDRVEPLLSMPAVLTRAKAGGWSRAAPVASVPGWSDPDGLLPLRRAIDPDPKAEAELVSLEGIKTFLDGKEPAEQHVVKVDTLYGFDNRIGIAVDSHTLTSAEGQLYAIRLLALQHKWLDGRRVCLYAELRPGGQGKKDYAGLLDKTPVPFGGEGKCVRVTRVSAAGWPKPDTGRKNSLWYLATPTFLAHGGAALPRRPLPCVGTLKAAASGGAMAVSGWDVAAGGPRATRFAVPAGATYFLDGPGDAGDFLNHEDENELRNLRREGWGFALQGKWEDHRG